LRFYKAGSGSVNVIRETDPAANFVIRRGGRAANFAIRERGCTANFVISICLNSDISRD
jgi:hypothetical protein